MEEKLMNEWGLREMTSSELQLRGGADKSKLATSLEKIRNLLDTEGFQGWVLRHGQR